MSFFLKNNKYEINHDVIDRYVERYLKENGSRGFDNITENDHYWFVLETTDEIFFDCCGKK